MLITSINKLLCAGKDAAGYILHGEERTIPFIKGDFATAAEYGDGVVYMKRSAEELSEGFWSVTSSWTNTSVAEEKFIFITEAVTTGIPYMSVIPCVMYNENRFGTNGEPKGLTYEGKPWIFSYSRTGLPSATISESEIECLGMFASADDESSLVSACSIIENDDRTYSHRIYYPEIETPVAYTLKYKLHESEPIINYITLKPGENFTATCYISVSIPRERNFGIADVYERASSVFDMSFPSVLNNNEVWERALHYAKDSLALREKGYTLLKIGFKVDSNGKPYERPTGRFEIGWCGQNASFALAMITDWLRTGDESSLNLGVDVIDTWINKNSFENGFAGVTFNDALDESKSCTRSDSCNLGWAALQVLAAYSALKSAGKEKPTWKKYGLGICDYVCRGYSDKYAFGMIWDAEKGLVEYGGSAGIFLTLPLIEAYKLTSDKKYLDFAVKALTFYDERDLKNFACAAGALDTSCVDKETCWPFMHAANELYSITGEKRFLDIARRAGYYLLTWMYMYDVPYPTDSEFTALGFHTKGSTAVSVEHCHLDPWGSLIAFDFDRFFGFTGDRNWQIWANMLWNSAMIGAAPENFVCNGVEYPYGAQPEGFYHTNWVFSGDWRKRKGTTEKWFVAWPSAFRLCVLVWDKNFLESSEKDHIRYFL